MDSSQEKDKEADREQRRLNRAARKTKRLVMIRTIQRMRDEGCSTDEIAAVLGVSRRMAQSHASRHLGVKINTTSSRRLGAWAPSHAAAVYRSIAERAGVPVSQVVGRVLAIVAERDGSLVYKLLGKEIAPVKEPVAAPEPQKSKRELQREARERREREERETRDRERASVAAARARGAR